MLRVPHSFPTRRSSDLYDPDDPAPTLGGLLCCGDLYPPGPADQRDRKSTRLNSSHANISYAVFCLKKKKVDCALIVSSFLERLGDAHPRLCKLRVQSCR